MAEETIHDGNCNTVMELRIKLKYMEEQLKTDREEKDNMITKMTAIANDNATLRAEMKYLKDGQAALMAKFDKATYAVIAMFGTILVALIMQIMGLK